MGNTKKVKSDYDKLIYNSIPLREGFLISPVSHFEIQMMDAKTRPKASEDFLFPTELPLLKDCVEDFVQSAGLSQAAVLRRAVPCNTDDCRPTGTVVTTVWPLDDLPRSALLQHVVAETPADTSEDPTCADLYPLRCRGY